MKTQNKIRNLAPKITAMLISVINFTVSVNLPVLADVNCPIIGGNHEGDVAVTAGHFSDDNMAGVYATNTDVSVGNNLSVTSNTDPNVTDHNVTGVYVTDANVTDLDVSVGNDLTVRSNYANTDGSTTGIEARPAAGATADITIGNPETNEGNVTVRGIAGVRESI